jgi:membrane fusion protein, multidrug efflux system
MDRRESLAHRARTSAFGTLCAIVAGCSAEGEVSAVKRPVEAAAVVTALVESREHSVPIQGIGTARSRESVVITSRVSGRISEVFFSEGANVKSGTPLVRLEDDAERAEVRSATAAAEQARGRHRRLAELSGSGLIPRDDLDQQRQLADEAEARLELATVLLDQRTIRAPFNGTLGFREVSLGTLVQPGTAIVTLDALDAMRVMFSIPESLIAQVQSGTAVEGRTAGWREHAFTGKVTTVGTRVDEATRAVPVQALIDNSERLLKPGMLMTLSVQTKPRTVRLVPEAALAPENARQFVWRVQPDETVAKQAVNIGIRATGWVEIVEGVEVGDRVVTEGIGNLRPGRTVREMTSAGVAALAPKRGE